MKKISLEQKNQIKGGSCGLYAFIFCLIECEREGCTQTLEICNTLCYMSLL
jgi:hypothetical protein